MYLSEEQKAAYARLSEAVEDICKLENSDPSDDNGYLTKFVVVGMRQGLNSDGVSWSINFSLAKDGMVPRSDQLGLLNYAAARIMQSIGSDR